MRIATFAGLALTLALTSAASAGTIYVVDGYGGGIYDYTTAGAKGTFSTQQVGTTVLGAAFNSSGDLFTASRDSNAIVEYSPSGVASTFATPTSPYGLAINAAGDVFTAVNASTITEYTPGGAASVFATAANAVYSLDFNSAGDLFAGEVGQIVEYAPNGTATTFATGVGLIFGIAWDASGNLYAASWNSAIYKFTPGGTESVFASFSTNYLPTGLVYDNSTGDFYMSEVEEGISQPGQQFVAQFTSSGAMSTFASGLYLPYSIADEQTIPSPTPEPGTFVLVGSGIAMIAAGRLRIRSRFRSR